MNVSDNHPESPGNDEQRVAQASTADAAERLRNVAERIEEFVGQQISQLESAYDRIAELVRTDPAAATSDEEFESRRRKWEQERNAEIRRLRDEGQLLSEAWEQLEAEQRRLLGERGSLKVKAPAAVNSANPAPKLGRPPAARTPPTTDRPDSQNHDPPPATTQNSREQAVRQFQHLKREIGKHHRNKR